MITYPTKDDTLSIILKLPGEVCNLNCHYCYEKRKPSGKYQKITPDLLRKLFEKAEGRNLSLEFHGGEPLIIGKKDMVSLLKECQKYRGKLRIVLQTNATLLDQEWLDLFNREWPEIEFATSIDGDPATTIHRVDYNDNNVHPAIEQVFELFSKNDMKLGVICTVTRQALESPQKVLDYFLKIDCINLLKLNPCFDFNVVSKKTPGNKKSFDLYNPEGIGVPGWGITPLEFSEFLKGFFDIWVSSGSFNKLLVEPFLSIIRVVGGRKSNFCIYDQQKCSSMLTLYPDGRLSSCDELDISDSILISHIDQIKSLDDILYFQTNKPLKKSLNEILEKCRGCDYREICNGGCLATRKRYAGSQYYEEYCQYRIEIIDHVFKFINREDVSQ